MGLERTVRAHGQRLHDYRAHHSLCEVPRSAGPELVSGKQRRELARQGRRLSERHTLTLRRSGDWAHGGRDFAAFQSLHARSFGADKASRDRRTDDFHRAFAERMAARGRLRMWTLDVDGTPGAALYGWRLGGRVFAYMQAFDRRLEPYGVGIRLLAHAIEDTFADGADRFDMLRGEERHKRRFAVDVRPVETRLLTRRRGRGTMAAYALVTARRTWQRLPGGLRRSVRGT
jgi:CelD/BcsL family acetyltransferase involved in cellulose biosynthesis